MTGLNEEINFGDVFGASAVALGAAGLSFMFCGCLGSLITSKEGRSSILILAVLVAGGIGVFTLFRMLDQSKRTRKRLVAERREQYELEMASLREQMAELDTEIATKKAQIAALEKCSR